MSRRVAREGILRALFQIDLAGSDVNEAIRYADEGLELTENGLSFLHEIVQGTYSNLAKINKVIGDFAVGWTLERMPTVDRNILRAAVYEILYREDIPESVVVNEAVELAKKYGDVDSPRFINGVLGNVVQAFQEEQSPR
ncbi:MAG: transcription antitermination factor NusB [Limnochordia bacterium]|jgi:N utilization substance protein B|nr:transcription antitermination factor NusB [Limnochordia bacterium]MDD2630391.1 transcription antitermination factor NusB [Limnochordia bacterium]MDD4518438.1 transcription antitermination factor NusB [Limnochordia bacterium]